MGTGCDQHIENRRRSRKALDNIAKLVPQQYARLHQANRGKGNQDAAVREFGRASKRGKGQRRSGGCGKGNPHGWCNREEKAWMDSPAGTVYENRVGQLPLSIGEFAARSSYGSKQAAP